LLEVSAKRTDKCSQRDKSRADPSENDAEHRLDQCSQSNQQVLMEDNWLSEHNSSADLSLKLYATQYGEKNERTVVLKDLEHCRLKIQAEQKGGDDQKDYRQYPVLKH